MLKPIPDHWHVSDANELYDVPGWGKGYFSVHDDGHLHVHPQKDPKRSIDLKALIGRLQGRGVQLPVLVRFSGILQDRLREIRDAFARAIDEYEYRGDYSCVYPIKVNQQRQVIEEIVQFGSRYGFGLEAGSKPELLAVASLAEPSTPIVCNGFKDRDYIRLALLTQKLGHRVMPIVEKFSELELILDLADELGVRPTIGVRTRLAAQGSGRWKSSGGFRSKFGLRLREILQLVEVLRERDALDCLQLLHFHLGSQITNIRHLKSALIEAARVYVDLVKQGTGLRALDVGGGLGVDYDGSQTDFTSSVNYTLEEYANDVVFYIQSVCDQAGVPHPWILSESGRAVAAYHSALIFDVLGVSRPIGSDDEIPEVAADGAQPLRDLHDAYHEVNVRRLPENFHDAQQAIEMCMNLFFSGHLTLSDRATAEEIFWAICRKIRRLSRQLDYVPEELEQLDELLAHTYFGNFSLFQSIPDSWAIKQLFPVMPIHRMRKRPSERAVLGDITCDSDGRIDRFIDRRSISRTLRLHPFTGRPYYLGVFLVGAYQEILGDLHNLFGDTHAVHISQNDEGDVQIDSWIRGDSVADVLGYVQFEIADVMRRLQRSVERAAERGSLSDAEAGRTLGLIEEVLRGSTYLDNSSHSTTATDDASTTTDDASA